MILAPTLFAAACSDDGTRATGGAESDTEASSTGDSDSIDPTNSTTVDPDTSTTVDPTMTTTVDPDSSSSTDPTDAESSSTDPTDAESSSSGGDDTCGTGSVQPDEDCDGDNLDGEDCVSQGFSGGMLACTAMCNFDTTDCTTCGDDIIEGAEQCEGDDLDGASCMTLGFDDGVLACDACAYDDTGCVMFSCGNNAIEGNEVCDGVDLGGESCVSQGFVGGGNLGCAQNCGSFDTMGCSAMSCGNDIAEGNEVCDGADLEGETCVTQGFVGGVLDCLGMCEGFDTSGCTQCGNGVVDPGETCDGADVGGATCEALGFSGGQVTCSADCQSTDASGCFTLTSFCTSPNAAIGPNAGTVTLSSIPVAGLAGNVLDINVTMNATHTFVSDLDTTVRHVDTNTTVALLQDQCGGNTDVNATFDQDAAALPDCVIPIAVEGDVLPFGNLDTYVGLGGSGNGTWELNITDDANLDGGTLAEWCVEIATTGSLCGNGIVSGDEACDDGNANNGDGCAADCTVEMFSRCVGDGPGSCAPIRILYAPADNDDVAYRNAIALITGGVVDYYAANVSTPTTNELNAGYDCVFTHPNVTYADTVTLGTNLAAFVDAGGNVVLGIATGFQPPTGLVGSSIMAPAYAPMTTDGSVLYVQQNYSGDGVSAIHSGVVAYGLGLIDNGVVLQGGGIADGTYGNGTIATAYRPDFKVAYINGTGDADFVPSGDWARLTANACAVGFVQ